MMQKVWSFKDVIMHLASQALVTGHWVKLSLELDVPTRYIQPLTFA